VGRLNPEFLSDTIDMTKIELIIKGISSSQTQSGGYGLILEEASGTRRLPIIIGVYEAQSIAIQLEQMKPQRPLTHDLFKSFALSHGIVVKEVFINKFQEGIFYAEIHSVDAAGTQVVTDSRTSDAIAIALRFNCPVYTTPLVMSQTGVEIEPDLEEEDDAIGFDQPDPERGLHQYTVEELNTMLDDAVASEQYELASQIRDEIIRRKPLHD
jgi:uncharacterized protein